MLASGYFCWGSRSKGKHFTDDWSFEPIHVFHIFITTDSEHYWFLPWLHTQKKSVGLASPAKRWRGTQPTRNTRRWGETATNIFRGQTHVQFMLLSICCFLSYPLNQTQSVSLNMLKEKNPSLPLFTGCSVIPHWSLASCSPILTGVSSLSFTPSRCHVTVSVS